MIFVMGGEKKVNPRVLCDVTLLHLGDLRHVVDTTGWWKIVNEFIIVSNLNLILSCLWGV